jgi:hypothetical protein
MTNTQSAFEARPIDDVKRALLERAQENRNPFLYTVFEEVAPVINGLPLGRPRSIMTDRCF